MKVRLDDNAVLVGDGFAFSVIRTARVPNGAAVHGLPEHGGELWLRSAARFAGRVPPDWVADDDMFAPLHDGEAFWLAFRARRPHAVQVESSRINALTGHGPESALRTDPQNYLVTPPQPWLDGIAQSDGSVRQFVAETAPESAADAGLLVRVFPPRDGSAAAQLRYSEEAQEALPATDGFQRAVTPGGRIGQRVLADPFGLETWDRSSGTTIVLHFVAIPWFVRVTGESSPPPPLEPPLRRDPRVP